MKKAFLFMFFMLLASPSLWAAGIGFYGTGGVGLNSWKYSGVTASSTDYFYGGGLVVDSNVSKNETFGYRFTAGYEQFNSSNPNGDVSVKGTHRFSMSHAFGFGLVRTEKLRFWMGPRIGLHYLYKRTQSYHLDYIGADALLAFGLNVKAGDTATFFFDIGTGYMGNFNLNVSEMGNAFGVDGKLGFIFRINDSFSPAGNKIILTD